MIRNSTLCLIFSTLFIRCRYWEEGGGREVRQTISCIVLCYALATWMSGKGLAVFSDYTPDRVKSGMLRYSNT